MIDDNVTREEIEAATDILGEDSADIHNMTESTDGTFLLEMMLALSSSAPLPIVIRAAYHHGIRIGLQIANARLQR